MDKQQVLEQIAELIKQSNDKLREAIAIANKHDVSFQYAPFCDRVLDGHTDPEDFYYKQLPDGTLEYDMDSQYRGNGSYYNATQRRWENTGWNSSSASC